MIVKNKREDLTNWKNIKTEVKQTRKYIKLMQSSVIQTERSKRQQSNSFLPPLIQIRRKVKMLPNSKNDITVNPREQKNILEDIRRRYSSVQTLNQSVNKMKKKKYYYSHNNMILRSRNKILNKSKPLTSRIYENSCIKDQLSLQKKKTLIHSYRSNQRSSRYIRSEEKLYNQPKLNLHENIDPQNLQDDLEITNKMNVQKKKQVNEFDYIIDLIKKKKLNQFNCKQLKIRNKQINRLRQSFLISSLSHLRIKKQQLSQIVSPSVRIITHQKQLNKEREMELKRLIDKRNQYFKGFNFKKKQKKKKSYSDTEISKLKIQDDKRAIDTKQFCPWEQNNNSFYTSKFQSGLGFNSSLYFQ